MACACKNKGSNTPSNFSVTKNVNTTGYASRTVTNEVTSYGTSRKIVRRDFR